MTPSFGDELGGSILKAGLRILQPQKAQKHAILRGGSEKTKD